jgi:hypothetical protein
MKTLRMISAAAVALIALAACSNGAVGPPPVTSVNPGSPSYSHLQFAVGTANIAGQIGLNTVVTLRQPNGLSAVGYSTPVITWDGNFTNTSATGTNVDTGKKQISGSPIANPLGTPVAPSTFGSGTNSYGAFGYGFNNSNSGAGNVNGRLRYPCLPLYGSVVAAPGFASGTPNCATGTQYVGGPPAFPQYLGAPLAGELGSYLGFVPFAGLTPVASGSGNSTFNLTLTIPAASGNIVLNATPAVMTNFTPLPLFATPTFTSDGAGGGSIAYVLPAGVTEAYLQVVNLGPDGAGGTNCNFGPPPWFYTVKVGPGSPNPIGLGGTATNMGDNLAPTPSAGHLGAGQSTHTFCTAADNAANAAVSTAGPDQYQVFAAGFDYPAFEAAYPQSNGNPTPTIGNSITGQADVTLSDLGPVLPTL